MNPDSIASGSIPAGHDTSHASGDDYRQLFEAVSDAIFLIDNTTGTLLTFNTAATTLYGYSRAELATLHNFDLSSEPAQTRHVTQTTPIDVEQTVTVPLRYHRKKDGTVFPVEITGRFFNRDGRPVSLVAIRDITTRIQSERSIERQNKLLDKVGEIARIGGWELDTITSQLTWTGEVCRIHEVTHTFVPTIDMAIQFYAPEHLPIITQAVRDAIECGMSFDLELDIITAKGNRRHVHALGTPEGKDGKTVKVWGTFQDITERKQAEQERANLQTQLIQAKKMESVGRLAGGVAHDFNNMLQAIMGNLELAMTDFPAESPTRKTLEGAQDAARRSVDLTRQLLTYARRQAVSPKVMNLNDAVETMLKMLHRLIGEDIHLIWSPGTDLWPVKMDPSQVDQVLTNLCVNARDAITGTGTLTIETYNATTSAASRLHPESVQGDFVVLTVRDSGCGMTSEIQEHLFEPFFTTKELGAGTGLGLATVYGIVKQNGGFIQLTSEPGQGTLFQIHIPRCTEPATDGDTQRNFAPRGGGETILIVEDESAILDVGVQMLSNLGYRVLSAGSPEAALHLVAKWTTPIDLLITDIVMPKMNGRELAKRLTVLKPELKHLYMSGYTDDFINRSGGMEENLNFIQKPFSKHALATKVMNVLKKNH